MRTLLDHLTRYAAYHRDRRNIATHFVGIPMIVAGVAVLLSRPVITVGALPLAPVLLLVAFAIAFYLRLELRFGLVMTAIMLANTAAGYWLAAASTTQWLASGLGLFIVGWAIQFVGHYFEGRKPAFVDDIGSFLVGPLFVVAEAAFLLGLRSELKAAIEATVGPTLIRDQSLTNATRKPM
jgi:uncharacterized membrane protein YGL010W